MQCNKSAINHINTKTLKVHFAVKWKKGKSMISFAQASGIIKTLFCALFLFSTLHITLSIFLQFYTVVLVISFLHALFHCILHFLHFSLLLWHFEANYFFIENSHDSHPLYRLHRACWILGHYNYSKYKNYTE